MKSYIFKNPKLDFIELRYVEDIEDCVKMHLHEELTITAIKKGSLNLIFNDTSITVKTNEKSKDGYVLYLKKDYLKNLDFNFSSAFELIKNKNIYKSFIKLCDCLLDIKVSLIEKEENLYLFCLAFFSFEQREQNYKEESTLAMNIKKYLDESYLEEFILDELALKFDLTVVHLIRVFKKEFGLPIHSYILNKKVHLAKELLTSNISISQIAQNSGFFDQSHLNRSFKRIFQITTKEYQKNIFSKC